MEIVYECENSKKKDLDKILADDPYGKYSFARASYQLKEGSFIDGEKDKCYLYVKAEEELLKELEKKLGDLAKRTSNEIEQKIIKKINDEQDSAVSGFGDIFG